MAIWKSDISVEFLNDSARNTMIDYLGIKMVEVGADYLKASMPVDHRTSQALGLLHGGASVALAETVGTTAAQLCAEPGHYCLGLEINANHLRGVRSGLVYGVARPIHIGRTTQVWDIRISDESDKPVCISRLTIAVLKFEK